MTQKGGPGRANAVEGGNFVPVDTTGPAKTRPIQRSDTLEGLFAWSPDGEYGIYAGYDVELDGVGAQTGGAPVIRTYDPTTKAMTDVTEQSGLPIPADMEWVALAFQPFYSPGTTGIDGYTCSIIGYDKTNAVSYICVYNGGANNLTEGVVAPIVPGNFSLSYYQIGGVNVELVPNLRLRDIGFSWGGSPTVPATPVDQIPYGIVVGDGLEPLASGDPPVYCIRFRDGHLGQQRLVPYDELALVNTAFVDEHGAAYTWNVNGYDNVIKVHAYRKSVAIITYQADFTNVANGTLQARIWTAVNDAMVFNAEALTDSFGVINAMTFTEVPDTVQTSTGTDGYQNLRPEWTDISWTPNRNALMAVGRHGRVISITRRGWIFQTPGNNVYSITNIFPGEKPSWPDDTTVHTGLQWSPDGVGFLLTSKTFNSDPTVADVLELEDVSDAFVRNIVTYFTPEIGPQILTFVEDRVTGRNTAGEAGAGPLFWAPLNQLGQEHYRFAWHPFSRYAIFSVFGGLDRFDQDQFVDIGDVTVSTTVPQPLNVRIQDGDGATLADVIPGPVNRLAVDATFTVVATPDEPLFVQAPQQVVNDEINTADSVLTGAIAGGIGNLLDKDYTTVVTFNGNAADGFDIYLDTPLLISRVSIMGDPSGAGVRKDAYIIVEDVTGGTHVVYNGSDWDPDLVEGIDSGNFKDQPNMGDTYSIPISPVMAKRISYQVSGVGGPGFDIAEVSILKTIETKAFSYNEPSEPLWAENDQNIVNDEVWWANVTLPTTYTGDPKWLFDKNPVTSLNVGSGESMIFPFNTPHLVSRVAFVGSSTDLWIYLLDVDGNFHDLDTDIDTEDGWDSGNFTPIHATAIYVVTAADTGAWSAYSLNILKALEVKTANGTDPEDPLHIDAQQIVTKSEIASVSAVGMNISGDPYDLFDHDLSTGVSDSAGGGGVVTVNFKTIMLISRIAMRKITGGAGMTKPSIEVQTVDGTWHYVLYYVEDEDTYDGVDSGNFKDNVVAIGPATGAPEASPMECIAMRTTNHSALAFTWGELAIHKTIETKAYAYNEPREPLHTTSTGQVVFDEIDVANTNFVTSGTSAFSTEVIEYLFDKRTDTTISFTYDGVNAGSIQMVFRSPVLIDRIACLGDGVGTIPLGTTVTFTGMDGVSQTLYQCGEACSGFDVDNFQPVMAKTVVLSFPDDAEVSQFMIQKALEVKSYSQEVMLQEFFGQQVYFSPLIAGEYEYDYLLMRIPLEVDADDDPTQNLDSTTASFSETEEDTDRIDVYFHVPHTDIATVMNWARAMVTVEASANAHVSSVTFTIAKRNMVTATLTNLVGDLTVTDPAAGNLCDAEELRRVTANYQNFRHEFLDPDDVLVLRVRVAGAQDSSSATSSWLTLHHSRGSSNTKFDVSMVPR